MIKYNILKCKNIDINNLNIDKSYSITYNNDSNFLIQTPIFNDYELLNYNDKHYIDVKIDKEKTLHMNFLQFIDSLELKFNNYNNNNQSIKTQIITDIQNEKSVKIKLLDNTTYYNSNKNIINTLTNRKISLLIKIDYNYNYYSFHAVQILQVN